MSKKIVGIDVDGVLANFNLAYSILAERMWGNDLGRRTTDPDLWPPCWSYERVYGLEDAQVGELWKAINQSVNFWSELDILQSPQTLQRVYSLSNRADVDLYFITSRTGATAKKQTEDWLEFRVGVRNPTVLISSDKGAVAQGLRLTHFLDDKTENCVEVKVARRKKCEVFCLAAPYNKDSHFTMKSIGIHVVQKVEEFVESTE